MADQQIDRNILLAYVDGTLDDPQRRQIEALLSSNPTLRAEVDSLARLQRRLRDTLRSIDQTALSPTTTWLNVSRRTIHRGATRGGTSGLGRNLAMLGLLGGVMVLLIGLLGGGAARLPGGTGGQQLAADVLPPPTLTATATPAPTSSGSPLQMHALPAGEDRNTLHLRQAGQIARAFFDAYNRQDLAGVLAMLASRATYQDCDPGDDASVPDHPDTTAAGPHRSIACRSAAACGDYAQVSIRGAGVSGDTAPACSCFSCVFLNASSLMRT